METNISGISPIQNGNYNKINFKNFYKDYDIVPHQKEPDSGELISPDFFVEEFKNLFISQYGTPITEEFQISIEYNDRKNILTQCFIKYLTNNFEWSTSEQPNLLRYILIKIEKEKLPFGIYPFDDSYICLMEHNKVNTTLAFANRLNNTY